MKIVPIGLKAANEFVAKYHRHHKPVRGCKFCVSVESDSGECCGVAICGRPISRYLDNGTTLEITRVCTNGERNFDELILDTITANERQKEIKKPSKSEDEPVKLKSIVIDLTPRQKRTEVIAPNEQITEPAVEQETKASVTEPPDNPITEKLSAVFPLDTARRVYNAFENSKMPDWDSNQAKINRIKKEMYDVLGSEEQTERAFRIITSALQDVKDFKITDEHLGEGGTKAKYAANIAAIKTLKQIESENRAATPEEQEALSKCVGWGGVPQAFDENNSSWSKEYAELKNCSLPMSMKRHGAAF